LIAPDEVLFTIRTFYEGEAGGPRPDRFAQSPRLWHLIHTGLQPGVERR